MATAGTFAGAADALLDDVSRAEGLTDFGPDDFRPGLELLLETHGRVPLTPIGRSTKDAWLRRLLTNRLQLRDVVVRHPEILARPIDAPVVITGLARSGTTALHRILAGVPGQRVVLRYEAQHPAPPWGADVGEDPRLVASRAEIERMEASGALRALDAMHVIRADLPEEDYLLLEPAMRFASTGEQCWEPFRTWHLTADQRPAYEYFRTALQVLDWHGTGGRWLTKNPSHLAKVDQLIELFPGVRLIWTHRDPIAAVSSLCSLLWFAIEPLAEVDRHELCTAVADDCVHSIECALAARDRLGDEHFVDVDYRDLTDDLAGEAERVARAVGYEVTKRSVAALRRYADQHPQDRHGLHRHRLDDVGLDERRLRERFSPYTERFQLD